MCPNGGNSSERSKVTKYLVENKCNKFLDIFMNMIFKVTNFTYRKY